MASRIDYSQNRRLYVGTTDEISVADGKAIISGSVGIGVTGPVAPLDVFGAAVQNGSTPGIKLSSSNTQQTVFAIGNTGTRQYELAVGGTTSSVPGAFYIYDNNAADFRITLATSGNVGINTNTPQVKLQIYGNAMPATGDAASVEDMFTLYRNGSATVWSGGASLALGRYSAGNGSAPKSRLDFKLKNAAGSNTALPETTVMTMQSNGSIGIGTVTPQKKVHIEGTGGASEMQILVSSASDTVGHTAGIGLRGEGGEADGDLRIKGGIFFERIAGDFGNGKMILAVNSSVSNTSVTVADHALTIDTNKNVGIGTTSPGAKLDVVGAIKVGNSGTSRFTDTSAFPLQLNRGLDVDVFGANGCSLGIGSLKGTTYIDAARFSGALSVNGTDGNMSLQTLGSGAYSTAITLNSVQAVRFNGYDSTNNTGTPTYLLGTDSSGNVVKTITGATTGTQVHTLPNTSGTASWKKIGTFTANNGGQSVFIKIVTNNGYNSSTSQNVEAYIRFKTSNGSSLDPNGFSGDSSFYTHGPNGAFPAGDIKWVSNAAGASATSYALYVNLPAYSGNGGFAVVENSVGTWVNNMSNASDPGAGSSTVLIPAEQFRVGSTDFVVNGGGGDAYFANSKVGIGLTSPSTTLSIQGTSSNGINIIGVGTTATRCYLGLNAANKGYLFISGSSGENPAVITSQGNSYISTNLGIGETSPDQKLNVREDGGSDAFRGIEVHNNSASDARAGICFKAYDWVQSAIWHGRTSTAAYAGALVLGTNPNTSDLSVSGVTGRMWILNNGYVGIGATPTYPLDVQQASTSGVIIRAKGIGAMILIESNTAGEAYLYQKPNITSDKEARFMMTAGTSYGWAWSDDGSGTVSSRVKYMKLDQNPGTLTVKGDVIAYGTPSDISLKENIKPIDSALDKVMKLQGVTFDWKKTDSILELKEDIGFIAQDVQKVVPELIRENSNGLLSMRHQGVAPILLEAIKELKAEIDLLKSKPCTCNKCNCNI